MFKRLHQENRAERITIKKADTYKQIYSGKSNLKLKTNSYGEKYKQKTLHPNTNFSKGIRQIYQTENYFFQGNFNSLNEKYQKHGEGVLFMKNGMMVVGVWDHGLLEGDALIFSPFGGQTLAQFSKGKLSGWSITKLSDKLVTFNVFYDDKIDGQKIVFENSQQLWVASKYCPQLNSYQITHAQKGKRNELPSFLKSSYSLQQKFYQFVKNENLFVRFQQIRYIPITTNLSYLGYSNSQLQPQGLGIIFSKNQFYMGNFQEGSLQKYGRMLFQNGEIYHGQLTNGVFSGQGVYYNPNKNMSTIMQIQLQEEQEKTQQMEGYIAISINLGLFKTFKSKDNGITSKSLQIILQTIQKYYFHYYIQKGDLMEGQSIEQQFGISEKNQDQILSLQKHNQKHIMVKQKKSNNTKPKIQNQKDIAMDKKWLNFKYQGNQKHQDNLDESYPQLQRQFSLDKRNRNMMKSKGAKNIYSPELKPHPPMNLQNSQSSLDLQFNKIGGLDRNLSLNQRHKPSKAFALNNKLTQYQSIPVKQNIDPQQGQAYRRNTPQNSQGQLKSFIKKNNVGVLNSGGFQPSLKTGNSLDSANINYISQKNEYLQVQNEERFNRKYSHALDQNKSQNSSQISRISQKVNKVGQKQSNNKRKKIFI